MNDNLNSGLSEELVLRIFTDVCEAVAALHHSQPPVQHRDLKVQIAASPSQYPPQYPCHSTPPHSTPHSTTHPTPRTVIKTHYQ